MVLEKNYSKIKLRKPTKFPHKNKNKLKYESKDNIIDMHVLIGRTYLHRVQKSVSNKANHSKQNRL